MQYFHTSFQEVFYFCFQISFQSKYWLNAWLNGPNGCPTNRQTPTIGWQLKLFNCIERGMYVFGKPLTKAFQNHMIQPPFLATKKIQLPSNNGGVSNGNKKNINCHSTHPHHWMVTKSFRSPQKGMCHMVLESPWWRLSKNIRHAPFLDDQNNLIAIRKWRLIRWSPNFFNCHQTHSHHQMTIEIFQWLNGVWAFAICFLLHFFHFFHFFPLPWSYCHFMPLPHAFLGDRKNSITIGQLGVYPMATKKIWLPSDICSPLIAIQWWGYVEW